MPDILTQARESVRDSIRNWPELQSVFEWEVWGGDELELLDELEPSMSRLPAIILEPSNLATRWKTNRSQEWPYTLNLMVWTRGWSFSKCEKIIEQIILALHRAAPSGSGVTYVKTATGREPNITSVQGPRTDRLADATGKGTKVTTAAVSVVLTLNRDPFPG